MSRTPKWLMKCSVAIFLVVLAVMLANTWRLPPAKTGGGALGMDARSRGIDGDRAVRNLAKAISFRTDSTQPEDPSFGAFRDWLEVAYPLVHDAMELRILGGGTLLFEWPGSRSDTPAVLLAGHYDVVPADPSTLLQWSHEPFAGAVAEGFVWGRGALDNKGAVIALLEAAELLVRSGFRPERTIYLSFGHDEEVGGTAGARSVVSFLQAQGVRIAWSLDEGSFLFERAFPGIEIPVASINVAEKGYVTLAITAKGAGGHSSVPPRETAVDALARALVRIQDNPMPGGLDGVAENMFAGLAPHLGFTERFLFANRWALGPALELMLSSRASTDALLRTTAAATMLSGSIKENVLPAEAVAVINFRIHPRDTPEQVVDHIRGLVSSDVIEVAILNDRITPPSGVSSHRSEGYDLIARSLRETFGDVIVVPGLTMAGTDSKHYAEVSTNAYRINPFLLGPGDAGRIHGLNERISIQTFEMGILAYVHLIERL